MERKGKAGGKGKAGILCSCDFSLGETLVYGKGFFGSGAGSKMSLPADPLYFHYAAPGPA